MALIVETGAGLSDAESYVSVSDADTYHFKQGNPSTWSTSTTDQKESALRVATAYLDGRYGLRWVGRRINQTMALDWPRYEVTDRDGWSVASTAVPTGVKNATAYVALKVREGDTLVPDVDAGTSAVAESVTVGSISIESTYAGAPTTAPSYPTVDLLLRDLAQPAGSVVRA